MTQHSRAAFPPGGRSWPDLQAEMAARTAGDADWRGGRTAIFFFLADDEAYQVGKRAYMEHFSENALGAGRAYPGIGAMERDVVDYGLDLMHAPAGGAGVFTTGGTESVLLGVKAARERHRALGRGKVGKPLNIVMPVSGHPAFDKTAILMDVEVRRAPLRDDRRCDVEAMRGLIDENTFMVMGSAPCFPHGVIDPIAEISALALERDVWMHVDACVGGWVAPFFERIGRGTPVFDFRNGGVRSISADLHKFGFAPKPSSTVFFRDGEDLDRSTFRLGYWPSGLYTTATLSGSRPAGAVAGAWAVLNHLGISGYERAARDLAAMTDAYVAGIRAIPELELWAQPDVTILNFGSRVVDIYAVAERMKTRGWIPGLTSEPRGMHTMLAMQHAPAREAWLADMAASIAEVRATQAKSDLAATY
ncbi:MAG: aspartate aminotransferase family protein [Phenylobacterium sp.]|uniref:aminotransferase class V-fold PLP-dependent enzyme n=1 Tax=Phenylobacterium sp. TaxID=1871053 RepID=UPI001A57297F|nr:aminotransferase class V-fold PLP-dependent enzyme [Phenylobacterium sp.]MBL8773987.1 aspartate aminotransferase family protein [Phenylobacterium sp.]